MPFAFNLTVSLDNDIFSRFAGLKILKIDIDACPISAAVL